MKYSFKRKGVLHTFCNRTVKAQTEGTQIRRLNSANYKRGLTLLLDSKSDDYFVTADDFVGFKVT